MIIPDTVENDPAVDEAHHGPLDYQNLLQVFVPRSSVLTGTDNLDFDPVVEDTAQYSDFVADIVVEYDLRSSMNSAIRRRWWLNRRGVTGATVC